MDQMFSGVIGLTVLAFLFIIGLLWFCLPFAVFGVKAKIEALSAQLAHSNRLLQSVHESLEAARAEAAANAAAATAAVRAQTAAAANPQGLATYRSDPPLT